MAVVTVAHPILVLLEINSGMLSEDPQIGNETPSFLWELPDPRGIDCGPVVHILKAAAAEMGEQVVEVEAEWSYGRDSWLDDHGNITDPVAFEEWCLNNPAPEGAHLESLRERAALLVKKAVEIERCGRDLLALYHAGRGLFEEQDTELKWSRCRVRGCPWCGLVDALKIKAAAIAYAEKMSALGYELRVLHLTLPGDPRHTLKERSTLFKAALKRLGDNWRGWKDVDAALVFYESPLNAWRSSRLEGEGIKAGDGEHWHWHAHVLVWTRPCNAWAPTDPHGRYLDADPEQGEQWSPVAAAWSRATGVPLGTLRVSVDVPFSQNPEHGAAVGCAVAYAAKYASKGTSSEGMKSHELVRWVLESKGVHLMDTKGRRWARSLWSSFKSGHDDDKPVVLGLLDELERRAERWEVWEAETGATIETPKIDDLVERAELAAGEAEEAGNPEKRQLLERAASRDWQRAAELEVDRQFAAVLQFYNGKRTLWSLEGILGDTLEGWARARAPKDWSDILARQGWYSPAAPWRIRQRALGREHGDKSRLPVVLGSVAAA